MRWKIALILLVLLAALYLYKTSQIKNAFDEMYYDKVPSFFGGYSPASFKGTRILGPLSDGVRFMAEDSIYESVNSDYLKSNEVYNLYFYKDEARIVLSFNKFIAAKTNVRVKYEYGVNERKISEYPIIVITEGSNGRSKVIRGHTDVTEFLKKRGITERTIEEYRHYMLYDTLLANWFKENKGKSKFDLNNIGELTIVKE
ncbi:TipC family immunity protein [Numidum massiliense]|uniref:TipC family immunity protein n=1 Tax=Numidum massiliense TaxID=1522315 RepID=UPI0021C473B8|nr:TipC family immunity protein [Numidum massiliense]